MLIYEENETEKNLIQKIYLNINFCYHLYLYLNIEEWKLLHKFICDDKIIKLLKHIISFIYINS